MCDSSPSEKLVGDDGQSSFFRGRGYLHRLHHHLYSLELISQHLSSSVSTSPSSLCYRVPYPSWLENHVLSSPMKRSNLSDEATPRFVASSSSTFEAARAIFSSTDPCLSCDGGGGSSKARRSSGDLSSKAGGCNFSKVLDSRLLTNPMHIGLVYGPN